MVVEKDVQLPARVPLRQYQEQAHPEGRAPRRRRGEERPRRRRSAPTSTPRPVEPAAIATGTRTSAPAPPWSVSKIVATHARMASGGATIAVRVVATAWYPRRRARAARRRTSTATTATSPASPEAGTARARSRPSRRPRGRSARRACRAGSPSRPACQCRARTSTRGRSPRGRATSDRVRRPVCAPGRGPQRHHAHDGRRPDEGGKEAGWALRPTGTRWPGRGRPRARLPRKPATALGRPSLSFERRSSC